MKKYNIIPEAPCYIALSDLNFDWDHSEVIKFENLWNKGLSLQEIAFKLKRNQDEIAVIILDRARKGKIKKRKNGIFGEVS